MKLPLLAGVALVVLFASGADARRAFAPEPAYADFGPVLSPDGTKLAFLREGITPARLVRYQSLYVSGANGRGAVALTQGKVQSEVNVGLGVFDGAGSVSWAPDSRRLVYSHIYAELNDYVHSELVIADADGSNPRQLTTTDVRNGYMRATFPSWSVADRIVFSVQGHIEVIDADGSNMKRLTPGDYDSDPSWSPDGSKIAFITGGDDHLAVMNADGTGVRTISPLPSRNPAWSRDGRTIVFSAKQAHNSDIYAVAADGTGQRRLTTNAAQEITPVFTADSGSILFGSNRGRGVDSGELWVMRPDGSHQRLLVARTPLRTSDGRRCTMTGTVAVDTLIATPSADVVCAFAGNDGALGRKGDDVLEGGPGTDILDGGEGNDLILARDHKPDIVRGGPGFDRAQVDKGLDDVAGVEKLIP